MNCLWKNGWQFNIILVIFNGCWRVWILFDFDVNIKLEFILLKSNLFFIEG